MNQMFQSFFIFKRGVLEKRGEGGRIILSHEKERLKIYIFLKKNHNQLLYLQCAQQIGARNASETACNVLSKMKETGITASDNRCISFAKKKKKMFIGNAMATTPYAFCLFFTLLVPLIIFFYDFPPLPTNIPHPQKIYIKELCSPDIKV